MKKKEKNYLFVCKHNFTRSRHGAEFFEGYLKGKNIKAKVDSAGLDIIAFFVGKRINRKILARAERVFVMENYMKDYIVKRFNFDRRKIIVLGIKDNYGLFCRKNIEELDKVFMKINWAKYL